VAICAGYYFGSLLLIELNLDCLLGIVGSFLFCGRLILLKSVLTALPVYALSFFKAPSGIISSMESLLNKFFWGGSEDKKKFLDWLEFFMFEEGVLRVGS
jgi:hypothetical protein